MTKDKALEHAVQKHIGYYYPEDRKTYFVLQKGSEVPKNALPLYEHPTQSWQGLTDYEIQSITWKIWGADALEPELDYARAIEQALKDKNS
jgi:hypothetical protein